MEARRCRRSRVHRAGHREAQSSIAPAPPDGTSSDALPPATGCRRLSPDSSSRTPTARTVRRGTARRRSAARAQQVGKNVEPAGARSQSGVSGKGSGACVIAGRHDAFHSLCVRSTLSAGLVSRQSAERCETVPLEVYTCKAVISPACECPRERQQDENTGNRSRIARPFVDGRQHARSCRSPCGLEMVLRVDRKRHPSAPCPADDARASSTERSRASRYWPASC